jgi:hypothetical protein
VDDPSFAAVNCEQISTAAPIERNTQSRRVWHHTQQ